VLEFPLRLSDTNPVEQPAEGGPADAGRPPP